MTRSSQAALDELEALLDELDRLSSEAEGDLVPLVGGVDGFLAALVLSPEAVPQDEWLGSLFSGLLPLLPEESAARLVELLLARKAVIAGQLLLGRVAFEPVYEVDGRHDEILWEIWIEGFDHAMQLRHPAWLALLESDDAALVQAFTDLAMLVGMTRGARLDPGVHEQTVAEAPHMIPFLAEIVYCRQRGLPTLALDPEPPQPIRVQKVGRNEPCPCGSGKKYKKCCGR